MRIEVHAIPGSARASVGGEHDGRLVVRVAQPAVDSKATEAVRRALASAFGVAPRDVALLRGATSRRKLFEVDGDDEVLARRARELRDAR